MSDRVLSPDELEADIAADRRRALSLAITRYTR